MAVGRAVRRRGLRGQRSRRAPCDEQTKQDASCVQRFAPSEFAQSGLATGIGSLFRAGARLTGIESFISIGLVTVMGQSGRRSVGACAARFFHQSLASGGAGTACVDNDSGRPDK